MYRILMLLFGKRFIRDLARMVAEEAIEAYELGQTKWVDDDYLTLDELKEYLEMSPGGTD